MIGPKSTQQESCLLLIVYLKEIYDRLLAIDPYQSESSYGLWNEDILPSVIKLLLNLKTQEPILAPYPQNRGKIIM